MLSASERRRKVGMSECYSSPGNVGTARPKAGTLRKEVFSSMESPWMARDVCPPRCDDAYVTTFFPHFSGWPFFLGSVLMGAT